MGQREQPGVGAARRQRRPRGGSLRARAWTTPPKWTQEAGGRSSGDPLKRTPLSSTFRADESVSTGAGHLDASDYPGRSLAARPSRCAHRSWVRRVVRGWRIDRDRSAGHWRPLVRVPVGLSRRRGQRVVGESRALGEAQVRAHARRDPRSRGDVAGRWAPNFLQQPRAHTPAQAKNAPGKLGSAVSASLRLHGGCCVKATRLDVPAGTSRGSAEPRLQQKCAVDGAFQAGRGALAGRQSFEEVVSGVGQPPLRPRGGASAA